MVPPICLDENTWKYPLSRIQQLESTLQEVPEDITDLVTMTATIQILKMVALATMLASLMIAATIQRRLPIFILVILLHLKIH
jgi:hypothetical protein